MQFHLHNIIIVLKLSIFSILASLPSSCSILPQYNTIKIHISFTGAFLSSCNVRLNWFGGENKQLKVSGFCGIFKYPHTHTHSPVLTSWQYCRMPSLVPMQLLVPEGSGSHLPLCTLMCMLSLPQNMATWGSAKRPIETSVGTWRCGEREREKDRERDLMRLSTHVKLLEHLRWKMQDGCN